MPGTSDPPKGGLEADEIHDDRRVAAGSRAGTNTARPFLIAVAVAALAGAWFSAQSTADFISHLDRQVHSIHCSFIPGAAAQVGESGCRTIMMSPYSSLFRTAMWGGLPISLLALAVFAYLVFRGADFALRGDTSRRETGFLLAATLLPVVMSAIYGYIANVEVGAVCKLCVGVYVSSGAAFVFAIVAHLRAGAGPGDPVVPAFARWFLEGAGFVAVLSILYVVFAPENEKTLAGCGGLAKADDPNNVLFPYAGNQRGAPSIAVLDPLCPACRAFDTRLAKSGLTAQLNLRGVLFPLDSSCNWMVKESLHPGACAVSEAVLCEKDNAAQIITWAFEHQEELIAKAKQSDEAVRRAIAERFPKVSGCLGSAPIKNKLNKSLRWAVANALPVLTPQLFIGDRRVCDEDTDLGLEYTVTAMLARR